MSGWLVSSPVEFVQATVLSVIQGATEYLPISSSAHLILLPAIFGWRDQGLAFDIAVHVGTLLASIVYFRARLTGILLAWVASIRNQERNDSIDYRLGWFMIAASVPVALAGAFAYGLVQDELRSVTVIGLATSVFALLLWYADRFRRGERTLTQLQFRDALLIGLGQALAIIPGTSRSGITMTAALMLGLNRRAAAEFAFLLAIPAIAMAGGWQFLQLLQGSAVDWVPFGFAVCASGVVAFLCIHYFLTYIERVGMLPFVIYRLLLGLVILLVV